MASRGAGNAAQSRIPVKSSNGQSPAAKVIKPAATAQTMPNDTPVTTVGNGSQNNTINAVYTNGNNSDVMLAGVRASNDKLRTEIKRLKKEEKLSLDVPQVIKKYQKREKKRTKRIVVEDQLAGRNENHEHALHEN